VVVALCFGEPDVAQHGQVVLQLLLDICLAGQLGLEPGEAALPPCNVLVSTGVSHD